jgi:hypothetical protein
MRILVICLAATSLFGARDCEGLAKLALPNTIVERAQASGGDFTPPNSAYPIRRLPGFCRVVGSIRPTPDSDIRFEVWLPSENWNGNFHGIGNGGYAGSLNYGGLAGALLSGYAAATTDTGHQGATESAAWALHHPEKIIDFGWRAIHETAVKGKAFLQAYYGQPAKHSYFNSCSNGGRQALMEAQRFPEDYDGIVAGAPANFWTHLVTLGVYNSKALMAKPESYFPTAKLKAIQDLALAACDGQDLVKDRVLNEPLNCKPDYSQLLCQGPDTETCLTAPQLAALRAIHAGPRNSKGQRVFPPVAIGGEYEAGGWGPWITGPAPERSSMFNFGTQFYKNMVFNDPKWDYKTFDLDRDLKVANDKLAATLNATNPDLSRFHARGGKLILYHGWCDAAIPAENTIDYYRAVQKAMGVAKTAQFVRLFLAPGVQHCGGGAGPNSFGQAGPRGGDPESDVDAAMVKWVEKGVAPEKIIAAKFRPGQPNDPPERTRPLCAFPLVARYRGTGSTDDAASFTCAK